MNGPSAKSTCRLDEKTKCGIISGGQLAAAVARRLREITYRDCTSQGGIERCRVKMAKAGKRRSAGV
jgi:hypothetical protein